MTDPYYQDEAVTLYLGDCREITAWLAADVLVTDPPYGIAWASGAMFNVGGVILKDRKVRSAVYGDETSAARDAVLDMWGSSKPAVVFGMWRIPRPTRTTNRLIWHKLQADPGLNNAAFYSAEEEIYILGSGFTGKPIQNVLRTNERRTGAAGLAAKSGHPTPKPIPLLEQLIAKCPPGVVSDPFAGSGSTLVAARNQGRNAVGVEINEAYCELTAKRLAQDVLDFGGVT